MNQILEWNQKWWANENGQLRDCVKTYNKHKNMFEMCIRLFLRDNSHFMHINILRLLPYLSCRIVLCRSIGMAWKCDVRPCVCDWEQSLNGWNHTDLLQYSNLWENLYTDTRILTDNIIQWQTLTHSSGWVLRVHMHIWWLLLLLQRPYVQLPPQINLHTCTTNNANQESAPTEELLSVARSISPHRRHFEKKRERILCIFFPCCLIVVFIHSICILLITFFSSCRYCCHTVLWTHNHHLLVKEILLSFSLTYNIVCNNGW